MKESCFLILSQEASAVLFNFPVMTAITGSYRHIKNTMKTFITKVGLCISLAFKQFCNYHMSNYKPSAPNSFFTKVNPSMIHCEVYICSITQTLSELIIFTYFAPNPGIWSNTAN